MKARRWHIMGAILFLLASALVAIGCDGYIQYSCVCVHSGPESPWQRTYYRSIRKEKMEEIAREEGRVATMFG